MLANLKIQIKSLWRGLEKWITEKPLYFLLFVVVVCTLLIIIVFDDKSLWEWAELLLVPAGLVLAGYVFSRFQKRTELEIAKNERDTDREIALERQRQNTLENYFDRMKELILDRDLADEGANEKTKRLARTLTINVLNELGAERNMLVSQFLQEMKLLKAKEGEEEPAVHFAAANLSGADLREVNLEEAILEGANLSRANLRRAELIKVNLHNANLSEAKLHKAYLDEANLAIADLSGAKLCETSLHHADLNGAKLCNADLRGAFLGAILMGADFKEANLSGACLNGAILANTNLSDANLVGAFLYGVDLRFANLSGADLRDAKYNTKTKWPDGFDPIAAGAINVDKETE